MTWIRKNWDKVLSISIAIFGAGGLVLFFSKFQTMIHEYLPQAIFLASLFLAIGYSFGIANRPYSKILREQRREEKQKDCKTEDRLRKIFSVMSDRRRAIVLIALENRSVSLPDTDTDAATLCQLGILGAPPFGFKLTNMDFAIQPSISDLLQKHRNEWIGEMTLGEAAKIVYR